MAGRTSCVQTPKCASLMLLSCTCAHTLAPNPLCNRPPPLASASPTLASTLALAPTPCAPLHSRAPNPRRAAGRAQQLERGLQPHRQAALAAELSSKSTPVLSIGHCRQLYVLCVCDYLYMYTWNGEWIRQTFASSVKLCHGWTLYTLTRPASRKSRSSR